MSRGSFDYLPLIAAADRHRHRLCLLYRRSASSRCGSPSQFRALYLFLLNKWYFDELYDWLFVRTGFHARRRAAWKSGDGAVIDGLGPDGVAAATRDLARAGQPAADRLSSITTPSR